MNNEEINIMNNDNQKYYIGEVLSRENLTKQYQYVLDLIIAYGGEGSKIDADMLDGHHASDFITKDDYYLDVLQSGMYIGSTQINNYKTINSQFLRDVDVKLSDMECSIFDVYKDDSISNDSILSNINDLHYALELIGRHIEDGEYNFGEFINEYESFVNKEENRWANTITLEDALEFKRILKNHTVEAVDLNNNLIKCYDITYVQYDGTLEEDGDNIVDLCELNENVYVVVQNVPQSSLTTLDEEGENYTFSFNGFYLDKDYLLDAQPIGDNGEPNNNYVKVYIKEVEDEDDIRTFYKEKYILNTRLTNTNVNTNTFFSADMVNGLQFILITQNEYDNLSSELKDNWHYVYIIRDDINDFDDYSDPTKIYTTTGLEFKFRVDPETQEDDNPVLQFKVNNGEWETLTNVYYIDGKNDSGLIPYNNLYNTFEKEANKEISFDGFKNNQNSDMRYPSNKVLTDILNEKVADLQSQINSLNNIITINVKEIKDNLNPVLDRLENVETQSNTNNNNIEIMWKKIYPVGAIYISVNSTSPQSLFGGTWVQIQNRFLLSAGSSYSNGSTGGSADAVVVSHTHKQNAHRHDNVDSDNNYKYLLADGNIKVNGTPRGPVKETGTGNWHYVYDNDGADIIERRYTEYATASNNSVGVSGVGKNMPPYLTVYMWKRTQ